MHVRTGVRSPHTLSVVMLRSLAEALDRLALDGRGMLAELGIDDATAPGTYVAGPDVDRLLEKRACNDPALALALAEASVGRPVRTFSSFGFVVWLSRTIGEALARAIRFYGVMTRRATLDLEVAGNLAALRQYVVPGYEYGRLLTELAFASCTLSARIASEGRFTPSAVRFTHARDPALVPRYASALGAPVTFGAAHNELVFDRALLDVELATADPITCAMLEPQLAALATAGRSPLVDRLRHVVGEQLASRIARGAIAKRLGMSERTLRRRLEDEGVSLRGVIDDVRRDRAETLLAAGTPHKAIAAALGFSEASAFSRAYRRWTGRAPTGRD